MQFHSWFRLHEILYQLQNTSGGATHNVSTVCGHIYKAFKEFFTSNEIYISLLTMETQCLPTPPAHVSKTARYKLNMSYDLFDFVFYNDYFANKKP